MVKTQALLASRRFWTAVAALVLAVGNDGLGLNLSEETVTMIVMVASAWIVGDSVRKAE